jgi:superfamily II DNA or RNA helicase
MTDSGTEFDEPSHTGSGLPSHSFLSVYESGRSDLLKDFYRPALGEAEEYCRAVGYFSSSLLPLLSNALVGFVGRKGRMRLIISPSLTREDADAIERGYRERSEVEGPIGTALQRDLEQLASTEGYAGAILNLAWLVKHGVIEVKVAVPFHQGAVSRGIYHEKLGYFRDSHGNVLAFQGSPNESLQAVWSNFESIWVSCSWKEGGGAPHLGPILRMFDERWTNQTPGLIVKTFPEAQKAWLIVRAPDQLTFPPPRAQSQAQSRPLRDYQLSAIKEWMTAGSRGILEMATGSGKTLVALRIIQSELREGRSVLVAVPTRALLDQWGKEARRDMPGTPIISISGKGDWLQPGFVDESLAGDVPALVLGVTNTLVSDRFLARATHASRRRTFSLVVDEVHHVGARTRSKLLGLNAFHRLGLSATPEREYDDAGTAAILEYFGRVVYRFDLGQAIHAGVITPYEYLPDELPLTDAEGREYRRLAALIAGLARKLARRLRLPEDTGIFALIQAAARAGLRSDAIGLTAMLQQRADVTKKARGKVAFATKSLVEHPELRRVLVYCDDGEQLTQVDESLEAGGVNTVRYVGQMDDSERTLTVRAIEGGTARAVLSMKCLDEGVDFPSCDGALILASSKTWREFVQRRGRVLRRHEGKRLATIIDPIVVPSEAGEFGEAERAMITSELRRAWVFVQDSANRGVGESKLRRIGLKYGLSLADLASDDRTSIG